MGFFKSLFNEAVNDLKEKIVNAVDDVKGIDFSEKVASKSKSPKSTPKEEFDHDKQVYGVDNIRVKYNGSKYAVCFTDKKAPQETSFIFDDIIAMSHLHLRTSQVQKDGSILYGVVTGGASFSCTDCEYINVDFFDEETLLATDADDDQYTINYWGKISSLDIYMKELEEELLEEEDSEDEDFDSEEMDEDID